jgi:hypothetical protein
MHVHGMFDFERLVGTPPLSSVPESIMAAQHVHEIDAAIKELISSRRQEILQIAQNGANPGPLKNLVEIQTAIDALYRAREQEEAHS